MFTTPFLRSGAKLWSNLLRVAGCITLFSFGSLACAIGRDFTITTNQSSISVSGTVTNSTFGTAPIQQQGPGGLTTTYSGTIKTDRGSETIQFLEGSLVSANNSGSWRPLANAADGTAPANYGARVSYLGGFTVINFAGRNLVAGLVGTPTTINGNQFDLASTNVLFQTGDLAYRGPFGNPMGMSTLANQSSTLSGIGSLTSLTQSGITTETLTFPVNATFQFAADASNEITLTLTGTIVATSSFTPPNADYNRNGIVDAADYVVWRNSQGQSGAGLPVDGDGNGFVNALDYGFWRSRFGLASASGQALPVPEPTSLLMLIVAATVTSQWRRLRSR